MVKSLTDEQKAQYNEVVTTCQFNLKQLVDSLQTLDNPKSDSVLEYLDSAQEELEKLSF